MTSWVVVQKIYSEMYLALCTNTHCDVTDLINDGMVKNTKTRISLEQNIIFLWNEKVLNLCVRWHILRGYRLLEVCTPLSSGKRGGLILLPNFQEKEGAWQDLNFQRVVACKKGGDFFQGGWGCSFYIKNKLKYKIFNDKKSL